MAPRHTPKELHAFDVHVGSRLKLRRMMLGLTQERLADMIGLTFQQVQKYEKGSNRISASRLKQFSIILDVPVQFFFDTDDPIYAQAADASTGSISQGLLKYETWELVRAFDAISDKALRECILNLVKAAAAREAD